MLKQLYIHPMECYSAAKRNKLMIYAVTWMVLQGIVICQGEKIQSQKITHMNDSTYLTILK